MANKVDEITKLRRERDHLREKLAKLEPNTPPRLGGGKKAGALNRAEILTCLSRVAHTVPEICSALQISERTAWRHLHALLQSRKIQRTVVAAGLPHAFAIRPSSPSSSPPEAPLVAPV